MGEFRILAAVELSSVSLIILSSFGLPLIDASPKNFD